MKDQNLIKLRALRKEEKTLKKDISTTKDKSIPEALEHVPDGGTFDIEGVGKYTLKVDKKYDLSEETGKHARAWQKKKVQYDALQEQIDDLKDQQSKLQEKMDKDGENHVKATKDTDCPYEPKESYTVVVLWGAKENQ